MLSRLRLFARRDGAAGLTGLRRGAIIAPLCDTCVVWPVPGVTRGCRFFNKSQPIGVGAGVLGTLVRGGLRPVLGGGVQETLVLTRRNGVPCRQRWGARLVLASREAGMGPTSNELLVGIKLKSLILAQIERWRHALHMQVERQHGGNPGGEWRTGE